MLVLSSILRRSASVKKERALRYRKTRRTVADSNRPRFGALEQKRASGGRSQPGEPASLEPSLLDLETLSFFLLISSRHSSSSRRCSVSLIYFFQRFGTATSKESLRLASNWSRWFTRAPLARIDFGCPSRCSKVSR